MGFLTYKRRELLNALLNSDSVAEAARELNIDEGTARQRLSMLKKAHRSAKKDIAEYERYKMRMPTRFLGR